MSRLRRGSIIEQKGVGLPREYQEVEYLESTGTQWIDTGIDVVKNNSVVFECIVSNLSTKGNGGCYFFGATLGIQVYSHLGSLGLSDYNHILYGYYNWQSVYAPNIKTNVPTSITYSFKEGKQEIDVDGIIVKSSYSTVQNFPNITYYLFSYGAPNGTYYDTVWAASKIKYWGAKLIINGIIRRHFIPCYRISDSKPCMYDLVSQQPFFNQGTNEFILGQNVY